MNYLLNPPSNLHPARPAAAIAIFVIFFFLLILVTTTYFRILYTVVRRPGYVERGPQFYNGRSANLISPTSRKHKKRSRDYGSKEKSSTDLEKGEGNSGRVNGALYAEGIAGGRLGFETESPGLQHFYMKNVFICEGDGRPRWCSTCMNWKPDRAHHCREVQRCVRKMDHFCPW